MNDKLSKERWRKREGKIHNKSNKKTRRKTSDNSTQVDQDSSIQLLKQSTRLWLNYWAADHNRRSPSCRSVRIEHVVVNHCSVLMRETSTKVHGMFWWACLLSSPDTRFSDEYFHWVPMDRRYPSWLVCVSSVDWGRSTKASLGDRGTSGCTLEISRRPTAVRDELTMKKRSRRTSCIVDRFEQVVYLLSLLIMLVLIDAHVQQGRVIVRRGQIFVEHQQRGVVVIVTIRHP